MPSATVSLPFLFRIISLVALAIAWPLWMAAMPPHTIMMLFAGMGFVLGLIAGYRRYGSFLARAGVAVAFFAGSVVAGFYSALVASMWQSNSGSSHPLDGLGAELGGVILLFALPWVLGILLLLLRAWTWSAHDRMIYGQQKMETAGQAVERRCPGTADTATRAVFLSHESASCHRMRQFA